MVGEGDLAPDVEFDTLDGGKGRIADYRGKPLVLYFYPKDDTTGCTREAQDFTTLADDFAGAGVAVLGVSKDSVRKHLNFTEKYGLKVQLASDPEGALCEAYGVWVEKSLYGRKYMGIERATFLIDSTGRIIRVWRKVKVAGHAADVLAAARSVS